MILFLSQAPALCMLVPVLIGVAALAGDGLTPLPTPLPFALVAMLFLRAVRDFRWSDHSLYPWPAAARREPDA